MQPAQLRAAEGRLTRFLGALTPLLGRVERQTHASEYIRGLLLDGERKSITPITERVPGSDVQALRQFVHSFRTKAITDFGPRRSPVSREADHRLA